MDYLNPPGFLGTGASLLADVTLLAYVFLILPAMVAGYVFARTDRHRPHHRNTMMAITFVNWVLIAWLMLAALNFDVIANVGTQPNNARYIFPAIHALLGLTAQGLATYAVIRMVMEDTQVAAARRRGEEDVSRYWFKSAKPVMRIVLLLWFVTATLGILSYGFRYNILSLSAAAPEDAAVEETEVPTAGATPEASAPVATEDSAPATTPDVVATEEASAPAETDEPPPTQVAQAEPTSAPAETEEASVAETEAVTAPVETEEASPPPATPTRRPTSPPAPTAVPQSLVGALVQAGDNARLGRILVDASGRTLYVYANDEPGWSNCVGACLNNWEVYAVAADTPLVLGTGVSGTLGLSLRADGSYQVTFNDRPLYYFRLDRRPGDAQGSGADNLWAVVPLG